MQKSVRERLIGLLIKIVKTEARLMASVAKGHAMNIVGGDAFIKAQCQVRGGKLPNIIPLQKSDGTVGMQAYGFLQHTTQEGMKQNSLSKMQTVFSKTYLEIRTGICLVYANGIRLDTAIAVAQVVINSNSAHSTTWLDIVAME